MIRVDLDVLKVVLLYVFECSNVIFYEIDGNILCVVVLDLGNVYVIDEFCFVMWLSVEFVVVFCDDVEVEVWCFVC